MANSVDPDETPHSAASHLGLNCLLRPVCPNIYGKYGTCTLYDTLWLKRVYPGEEWRWSCDTEFIEFFFFFFFVCFFIADINYHEEMIPILIVYLLQLTLIMLNKLRCHTHF